MPKRKLHERLVELDEELKSLDSLDEESLETLEQMVTDIRKLLDETIEESPEPEPDVLVSLAARLEGEHPTLALAVRKVVEALGNMGI